MMVNSPIRRFISTIRKTIRIRRRTIASPIMKVTTASIRSSIIITNDHQPPGRISNKRHRSKDQSMLQRRDKLLVHRRRKRFSENSIMMNRYIVTTSKAKLRGCSSRETKKRKKIDKKGKPHHVGKIIHRLASYG